jgi:formate hydrogenlyase subunit 6/NADH:ubiquinone oxidoreductase subunit I
VSELPVPPAYERLVHRLNRFPQGAPPADSLYRILKVLFSEREAGLVAQLPIKPFTAEKAARIWKQDLTTARKTLDELASRAILVDIEHEGQLTYALPPPMAGFFEFSLMRVRDDVDQELLANLYYQYCTVEEDFMDALVGEGETQLGRVFVNEPVLPPEVEVLDYERASEVIKTATHRGIGRCYCRYKLEAADGVDACDAPQDICMTFNGPASALIKHGFAREVDVAEGLDLLQLAQEHNLVQFGENTRQGVGFICNCCGCCCEAMIAARRFALDRPINTTHFLPAVDTQTCTGCGQCVNVCPIEAMGLVSANDPLDRRAKVAKVNPEICLGCGVCARVCPTDSIRLEERAARTITPYDGVHRAAMMAIERGNLQDLIFDNRVLWSHRLMATLLGAILKLPPIQRTLATEQVKSRYLEALVKRIDL